MLADRFTEAGGKVEHRHDGDRFELKGTVPKPPVRANRETVRAKRREAPAKRDEAPSKPVQAQPRRVPPQARRVKRVRR
jgi:hypothetical protein